MERPNKAATKYYDRQFCMYLSQGDDPALAAEKADLDLLAWSQPLPLPDAPDSAWWE